MLTLQESCQIISKYLNELKLPELPSNLYNPIRYMLDLRAKRLRPSLVLMSCNLFTEKIEPAIFPALAIEIFHNFTLVHDDLMDQSKLRRNQKTVHEAWSPNIAILSGDAMLIKAYELLTHNSPQYLEKIMPVFNETALKVCEGQQYDMDFEKSANVTIDDYLKMIELKTAVLIAASLKIGALIGGGSTEDADLLYEFGRNIGIAFQLQDDLLDVFADSNVFGKATGNDIVYNKKTILLIEALETASLNERKQLINWLAKSEFEKEEKINAIKEIFISLKIDQKVNNRISEYYAIATSNLTTLNTELVRKKELFNIASALLNRKK